jgi:hypothetical protein
MVILYSQIYIVSLRGFYGQPKIRTKLWYALA